MKRRFTAILLLMVVLPLGLLAWLGVRVVSHEETQIKIAFDEILQSKMRAIDGQIQTVFAAYQQRLLKTANTDLSLPVLYDIGQKTPFASQFYLQASDGRLLFPPVEGSLANTENAFLKRTQKIFDGKMLFVAPREEPNQPSLKMRWSDSSRRTDSGWYTWHWDSDIHILFWNRRPDGSLFGAELSRSALIADIIALLPEYFPADPVLSSSSIVLRDSNNRLIYRMGRYVPADAEQPFSTISLTEPLHTWSLQFCSPPAAIPAQLQTSTFFNLFLTLFAVGLTLLWLALFLARENARERLEAEKRVSFVNQVSHELKTPLTNIRLFAELLEQHLPEDEPETRNKLNVIVFESQRLSRLIANVLTFSKRQHQKLVLKPQLVSPDAIITTTVEHFRPSFAGKGLTVDLQLETPAPVAIDPDVTEQILGNLFSNIEKYAASGKHLLVKSLFKDNKILIFVRDFGPGIPHGQLEEVFQPFTRLSDRLAEGASGTGIGLTIARDLARLHQGDVTIVWSNGPVGRMAECPVYSESAGVCFAVTLSAAPA